MKSARTTRTIKNAVSGVVNKLVAMLAPFIIRTIMIQKLGVEYLGLNGLFSSVLQMLSLSELGFGSAMIYSMYKPVAEGDIRMVSALLNYYKKIYRIIGSFILVVGLVLLPNIKLFIASDYPSDINIYLIYLIYLINTVVSYFLFAYKSSILIACQRSDIENNIISICNIGMYLLQILVLMLTANYYFYILLLPFATIVNNIIRSWIVDRQYSKYAANGFLDRETKHDLLTRVGALCGHRIGGVVFSSVGNLVISSFLGLIVLGKYTNYFYIYTAVNGIISIIFQSILAIIGNTIVCKSPEENYKTFEELFLLNAWQTCFCTCCFVGLYQPFMKIWMGEEYLLPFGVAVLLSVYYYIVNIRRVCVGYKDAAGMWKEDFFKPYCSVIVNIVFSIGLIKSLGVSSVVIGCIVAIVFVEIPWETKVLFNQYFKRSSALYYMKLIGVTTVCAISGVITNWLCNKIPEGIGGIVLRFIVCAIISSGFFVIASYKTKEFKNLKRRILQIIN